MFTLPKSRAVGLQGRGEVEMLTLGRVRRQLRLLWQQHLAAEAESKKSEFSLWGDPFPLQ